MNKSKIEWCDTTWNPVTGCHHGCPYCYARSIANRFGGCDGETPFEAESYSAFDHKNDVFNEHEVFAPMELTDKNGKTRIAPFPFGFEPTLHRYRLDEPQRVKKPQTVFVCSMADLFGDWVPDEWIRAVFDACAAAPQHRYLFLTKNPWRYARLKTPLPEGKNFWFGASATDHNSAEFAFRYLPPMWKYRFFLSAEPLLDGINLGTLTDWPRWIIIGAMTGPGAKRRQPRRDWISDIVKWADERGLPVFMKDSLIPIVGAENMRREFPWARTSV